MSELCKLRGTSQTLVYVNPKYVVSSIIFGIIIVGAGTIVAIIRPFR